MIFQHLIAITLAFCIDSIIGDPPNWPHPVRWIGSLISFFEKRWNKGKNRKAKGVAMLISILLIVGGISFLLIFMSYQIHTLVGIIIEAIIISTTIARKSLKQAAIQVYDPLIQKDFEEARLKLSYIVGRDTDQLDEDEITRGTVETVAENTSDGITAPLFWAFIGGGTLAMVYRAINTCDSMVGYKNERFSDFGWASAKWDDVVNWIPSRMTSLMMIWTKKPVTFSRKKVWQIVLRDAKQHPSPNSGWCEAPVAAMLGIQLGGTNTYRGIVSHRAKMGDPIFKQTAQHIQLTVQIMGRTTILFLITLWILGGILIEMANTWL
ncbi:adenosylcobinamide-phosphate synthase [Oikeobacillus pervagus]|uniref:Cobalamin biosynthesis protein CobD n=1 Tax=Oikeobacillus pervagus TaxID=1325931 RepID=A0AAJ1WK64_9BACI|nr:adenosylcobinamide-phosphate synthase CbiB [Oikeobacillus pervagus]MDQ0216420.1 adenosylcobinamide-phosphate synthase [Oikeobacillus pervagus]